MKAPAKGSPKARERLLRFLQAGPAVLGTLAGAPDGTGTLLTRRCGATLLTGDLKTAVADDLVRREGELATLTDVGRAWLARHSARMTPEPFARQHQQRRTVTLQEADGPFAATANLNESPLSRLAHRKDASGRSWIDREEFEAGERLARDFTLGRLRQRVTASWDPTARAGRNGGPGAQAELGDAAIDARARLDGALARLGPDLAGVALDVCCFAKGTSEVERDRCWPPRSAKLMLRTALALLARHYGLAAGEGRRPGAIRSAVLG